MERHKSVAFDTDGTLVDSDRIHYEAFNQVLAGAGLPTIDWETYLREDWISCSDDSFFERYVSHLAPTEKYRPDVATLVERKESATRVALDHTDVSLFPSIKEVIFHLTDDLHTPIFEVTGATKEETQRYFLKHPGLKEKFSALVSASDKGIPKKPDPECYREGLRRVNQRLGLSLMPAEVIAVEDSPDGIRAAKGAGMFVIGVTNTNAAARLSRAGAQVVVSELKPALFDALLSDAGVEAFGRGELSKFLGEPDWLITEGLPAHIRRWREFCNATGTGRDELIRRVNRDYTPEVRKRTLELADELDSWEAVNR